MTFTFYKCEDKQEDNELRTSHDILQVRTTENSTYSVTGALSHKLSNSVFLFVLEPEWKVQLCAGRGSLRGERMWTNCPKEGKLNKSKSAAEANAQDLAQASCALPITARRVLHPRPPHHSHRHRRHRLRSTSRLWARRYPQPPCAFP